MEDEVTSVREEVREAIMGVKRGRVMVEEVRVGRRRERIWGRWERGSDSLLGVGVGVSDDLKIKGGDERDPRTMK